MLPFRRVICIHRHVVDVDVAVDSLSVRGHELPAENRVLSQQRESCRFTRKARCIDSIDKPRSVSARDALLESRRYVTTILHGGLLDQNLHYEDNNYAGFLKQLY